MTKTFILSDEKPNSYGFKVLTSGIDLSQFKKNPVMLYMHIRASQYDGREQPMLPLGNWNDIRVENNQVLADPNFDTDDEFAVKIQKKVEKGFIRMASMGLDAKREDLVMLPGDSIPTLVKSKAIEASIADIASNDNCIVLYFDGKKVEKAELEPVLLALGTENQLTQNQKEMKKIASKLGLPEDATEDQICLAIDALNTAKNDAEGKVKLAQKNEIITMVDNAITAKKLTADKKDTYIQMGEKIGAEQLKVILGDMNPVVKLSDIKEEEEDQAQPGEYKDFKALLAAGSEAIAKFKKEKKAEYVKLYASHYGYAPVEDTK